MYHDYFDDADGSALRNPYGPEVSPLPDERGSPRPRLLLLGMVGAGLSVVVPAGVRGTAAATGHVTTSIADAAAATPRPPAG
jgi:hypothetical protein